MNPQTLLDNAGFKPSVIYHNLPVSRLIETSIKRSESVFSDNGALITYSGKFTGRSPKDKFIVDHPDSTQNIAWGDVNQKITLEQFNAVFKHVREYMTGKDVFVTDCYCGTEVDCRINVRFITLKAWHAHFINNMFFTPEEEDMLHFNPNFTVINATGYFERNWKHLGLNSDIFVLVNIEQRLILIGGTEYSGEMKKSIFSMMNYLLPLKGIMPMHCSANKGQKGDTALFFGLSGTGKTTLSADTSRFLIGDDEHGWNDNGVFNFENGCYAKCINLTAKNEPEIWDAIKFGSILENVVYDKESHKVKFEDAAITENTRVSYPIKYIHFFEPSGKGEIPSQVIFLTCDAFGVIPPVSKLSPEDANFHFLSGYTAKVAGTERGITEPKATFSTCFGAPFMMHHPKVYGNLLSDKMRKHKTPAYLVNTGWIGGAYGEGKRIKLQITRDIITAIINGMAESAPSERDKDLHLSKITQLGYIPEAILDPAKGWKNKERYAATYQKLVTMFHDNYKKTIQA